MLLASSVLPSCGCLAKTDGTASPNIVFILADDLGIGDPRCYNPDSKIPTPHMDRLAIEGLRFTDMHTPSAVCSPTRYGLLTGRYAWRSRLKSGVLWGWSPPLIEPGRLTLPAALKRQGYRTAGFGKWHLGLGWVTREPAEFGDASRPAADVALVDYAKPLTGGPHTAGFDSFFGIPASLDMEPYLWIENDRCAAAPSLQCEGDRHQRQGGGGFYRAGPIAPGFRHADVLPTLTQRAVRFLEDQAQASPRRPFFAYVALSAPHDPWLPTGRFQGASQAGPRGDFVVQTDHSVGEILAALDRSGLTPNTIVVFTSDNGAHWLPREVRQYEHAANGPWRGQKADIHEGGHRVPCLVRWPARVKAGTVTDHLTCLTDFFATFADIARASVPDDAAEDSFSFAPLLLGSPPAQPARSSLVLHSSQGLFALRRGNWKLVAGLGSGGFTQPAKIQPKPGEPAGQLYDLSRDPGEQSNRYAAEPELVASLEQELDALRSAGRSAKPASPKGPATARVVPGSESRATVVFVTRIVNGDRTALTSPTIHIHAPIPSPHQDVTELDVEGTPERLVDRWGAPVLRYRRDRLEPGANLAGRWCAWATLRRFRWDWHPGADDTSPALPPEDRAGYLRDGKELDLDSPVIAAAAAEAARGRTGAVAVLEGVFGLVMDRLTYDRDGKWQPAPEVLTSGKGSCSEYTYSFIALCRKNGIPARYVGGIVGRTGVPLHIDRVFHRFPQAHVPDLGWLDFDPTRTERANNKRLYFGQTPGPMLLTSVGDGGEGSLTGADYLGTHSWANSDKKLRASALRQAWWLPPPPPEVRARVEQFRRRLQSAVGPERPGLVTEALGIRHPFVLPWLDDLLYEPATRVAAASASLEIGGPAAIAAVVNSLGRLDDPEGDRQIGQQLDRATGQQFGSSRTQWNEWLKAQTPRAPLPGDGPANKPPGGPP